MKKIFLSAFSFFVLSAVLVSAQETSRFLQPWDESFPFPAASEVSFPEGLRHGIVHDCDTDPDYGFLHETAVGFLDDALIVGWYSNPKAELSGKTFQRARWSRDDGKTWSDFEVLMEEGNEKGLMYVGLQFLNLDGKLYLFSNQESGAEKPVNTLLVEYDSASKQWKTLGPVCQRFLSMQQPILMEDGNFIISGSYNIKDGGINGVIPTVYVSQGKDLAKPWKRFLMDSEYVNVFAETAILVEGPNVLGVTRLEASPYPNFYESNDYGRTWRKLKNDSFLASSSKFAAGTLSNGVRYVLFNLPDFQRDASGKMDPKTLNRGRHTLAIATAQPGEKAFSKIWKISDRTAETRQGASHYPCAVERDGKLYVTYTGQHKLRNCGITILPIDSLKK